MSINYTIQCINASAGSGKTTLIVNQIMKEITEYKSADHILCLTFSNAAAQELMQRIFSANANLQYPAKWNHQLAQTLHGFCLKLLRSHNQHYNILTTHMQDILWKKSLNDCSKELSVLHYEQLHILASFKHKDQLPDDLHQYYNLIHNRFTYYKTYESLLSFEEIISHTCNLIAKDLLSEALYHHLSHIRCLYIDESQDLSEKQWEIINAIINEIMQIHTLQVIVVGDKMQSIYSFQGASPKGFEIFQAVHKDMHNMHNSKGYLEKNMTSSYRCGKNAIRLVNAVFGLNQLSHSKIKDSVEMWESADDWQDRICDKIKHLLQQEIQAPNSPYPDRHAQYKPIQNPNTEAQSIMTRIQPKDILILIRKRSSNYAILADKLRACGISVSYDEYKDIFKQILHTLHILTSTNIIIIAEHSLNHTQMEELYNLLSNPMKCIKQLMNCLQLSPSLQNTILYNCSNFLQTNGNSIHSCILFFENTPTLETSKTNAVHIQTVHATKGMEAKIVFLCDTMQNPNFSPLNNKYQTEEEKNTARKHAQEEHKRLLYVGMTRAIEQLIIVNNPEAYKISDNSWYAVIKSGMQLLSEQD